MVHGFGSATGTFSLTAVQLPSITNIALGSQSAVDPVSCEYTQDLIVTYLEPSGDLVINGQSFTPTGSPQTVTLNLAASGAPVNIAASFSGDPGSAISLPNFFTAPACPCEVICPDDIIVNLNPGLCDAIVAYDITTQGY
jgi:hypothetical protein